MITLKVPSIACEVCAKTITTAIQNADAQAEVSIDIDTKIVQVNTSKPPDMIKEAIVEAGHTVDN
jgi:copper chaperone